MKGVIISGLILLMMLLSMCSENEEIISPEEDNNTLISAHSVVMGTSAGFVSVAPTSDPEGNNAAISGWAQAMKDVAPAGAISVTEIGWYCGSINGVSDTTVGIYTHNATDDEPEELLESATFSTGGTVGWKVKTGLNIPITAGETYWIAAQVDEVISAYVDYTSNGERKAYLSSQTDLPNPWGTTTSFYTSIGAIYAVYELGAPQGKDVVIISR